MYGISFVSILLHKSQIDKFGYKINLFKCVASVLYRTIHSRARIQNYLAPINLNSIVRQEGQFAYVS